MDYMRITRINHTPKIIKKLGWNRTKFIREAQYKAELSWPAAAKYADGRTDVDLTSLERVAALLNVGKDDILETRVDLD
jgi:hypothetical protein